MLLQTVVGLLLVSTLVLNPRPTAALSNSSTLLNRQQRLNILSHWSPKSQDEIKTEERTFIADITKSKTTIRELFQLFNLNNEAMNPFKSPVMGHWLRYAKNCGIQDPYEQILACLGERYSGQEITSFFFKYFKLDEKGIKVFESPNFLEWVEYVKRIHEGNHLMIETLYLHLGKQLPQMIARAAGFIRTSSIAFSLEPLVWRRCGTTAEEGFVFLGLNSIRGVHVFEKPQFAHWFQVFFGDQDLTEQQLDHLVSSLEQIYGKLELAKILSDSAKVKHEGIRQFLMDLQKHQINKWVHGELDPKEIFKDMWRSRDTRDFQVATLYNHARKHQRATARPTNAR